MPTYVIKTLNEDKKTVNSDRWVELPTREHIIVFHTVERRPLPPEPSWPFIGWPLDPTQHSALAELLYKVHGRAGVKALDSVPYSGTGVWTRGKLVAAALLRRRWGLPEIAWVSVLRPYRRAGLARWCVEQLLTQAKKGPVCAVLAKPNEVLQFWSRLGFHEALPNANEVFHA